MTEFSAPAFRAEFPIFEQKTHLASCSQGAASRASLAAIDRFVASWRDGGAPWDQWMVEVESAKARFARLINARVEDVAVVPNASIGAYAVASALDWLPGKTGVVTSDLEFPSLAHVWLAQQRRGAVVRHVRHVDGLIPIEAWEHTIGANTRVVSAFHTAYANGARNDLPAIRDLARRHDAYLFVDAYQAAGVMPIDVQALDVDFLVAGTLKYLGGTPGMAFLYVRPELAPTMLPTVTGWFARVNPFAFDPLRLDYAPNAWRFQTGTPGIVAAFTANAAIDVLLGVGIEPIWRHVQTLTQRATEQLLAAGFRLYSPLEPTWRGPQVTIQVENADDIGQRLAQAGIVASPRGAAVRFSFHGYNVAADVDHAVATLQSVVARVDAVAD